EHSRPLPVAALDALFLASGGIPALLTYGLQQLWRQDSEPTARDVTAVYQAFEERYEEYLRDLLSALVDPRLSDAPRRIWEYIREHAGRLPRTDLEARLGQPSGILRLDLTDALRLLEMSGVVRIEGSALRDDPVAVWPIAGLLNLPGRSPATSDQRQHFLRDLNALLMSLHRSSADFFRPGKGGEGKRLVPESVFAAYLALGFELLGWRSEREAQRGAGRTDLLLRRNGADSVHIVEVKLWGRNDYRDAHRQVESYWTGDVVAGAVVQLTDRPVDDWPQRYRRECLDPAGISVAEETAGQPVQAQLSCASATSAGLEVRVEHFLVRLARR
ncbi:MAG: hypothetical protein GY856_55405, partial [bacterium]|nr:hypothetical protein [bacterium]